MVDDEDDNDGGGDGGDGDDDDDDDDDDDGRVWIQNRHSGCACFLRRLVSFVCAVDLQISPRA
eukprot:747590-Hanusia_phi.AAC.2